MDFEFILFIVLALTAAISSVMMITRLNAIISAIFLIINFFALAGIYLLLNAQFISVVQVIVYAGAIMVLFLFVIMLLNTEKEAKLFSNSKYIKMFAIFIAFTVFVQIAFIIFSANPSLGVHPDQASAMSAGTVESIGQLLYTKYIIPFEASGFLLLAAAIGAIVLAKKKFK